jgi:glutaminase
VHGRDTAEKVERIVDRLRVSAGNSELHLDERLLALSISSVRVTGSDLATIGATLANGGVNPITGERALARARVRDVVPVMATCGCTTRTLSNGHDRRRLLAQPAGASVARHLRRRPCASRSDAP